MPDFALRGMSPVVHQALKSAAKRNHRSLNGEILARLEASVGPTLLDVEGLLARVEARRARTGNLELDRALLRELKSEGRP